MGKIHFFKSLVVSFAFGCAVLMSAGVSAANVVTATQTMAIPYGASVSGGTPPTTVTVTCPPGYVVVGGGLTGDFGSQYMPVVSVNNALGFIANPYFTIISSAPTANGNGWMVTGLAPYYANGQVTVYARCIM
ncbi:hypothetical protein [Dyella sp. GSA-30]|uniref:hypothetical protein n=1 Tax=Dyella sp. GSA-30 TaxID=2994496 RepID=UPI002491FC6B|nr:hypothetical protein [Dyella sp. GSA-30]BDU19982.1 hypothetical protein DYGSA30_14390 [Dyella sp. GSA-30]